VGETLDEVLVRAPEHIGLRQIRVSKVDPREVLYEARQHTVAVPGVPELALVVEVNTGEHVFELVVLLLQLDAPLVERLANASGNPLNLRPPGTLRHEEVVLVGVV